MAACTLRIAAVPLGIQAASPHTDRADHAAWCMPSPRAPLPWASRLEHAVGERDHEYLARCVLEDVVNGR
jgi:hypothetical protein